MKRSSRYGERDYAFGQTMLTLRTTIGLTQAGLADLLGVSRRAVAEWEAGSSSPKAEHLKHFIFGVAWSPDGKFLASVSYQQGVQVWEVTTGTCRWIRHMDSPARISCVGWSPDGTCLVSGGDDGSISLWEASDGTLLRRFQGHHGIVMTIAWSPNGTYLASGSGGKGRGELFVWDARSGERLYVLSEPSEKVYALAWSPTGAVLVSGGNDGMLRWWNLRHGECARVRKAHQRALQSLKRSPDGQRLASCGADGAIQMWDLESGEHVRTLRRDRPYERVNISGVQGLTDAQRATLRALGAIEDGTFAP